MIRVGIAEDEPLVLAGLKSMLCMSSDMELVFEAGNGRRALEMIETETPDVVITDIKMPVMTGLEMIEQSKKTGYHTEFIVVSSYDEFELAREALRVGASSYLIKLEITSEGLEKEIRDIYERKQASKKSPVISYGGLGLELIKKEVLQTLLRGNLNELETLHEDMARAQMQIHEENIGVLFLNATVEDVVGSIDFSDSQKLLICVMDIIDEVVNRYFSGYSVCYNQMDIVVVCSSKTEERFVEHLIEACEKIRKLSASYFSVNLNIGVSLAVHGLEKISTAYAQAKKAYKSRGKKENIAVYCPDTSGEGADREREIFSAQQKKELLYALEIRDAKIAEDIISQVIRYMLENELERDAIMDVCMSICYLIRGVALDGETIVEQACKGQSVASYAYYNKNIPALIEWLEHLKLEIRFAFSAVEDSQMVHNIVQAKKYIREHLESKFGLDDVAEYLNISSGYLSSAFKKQTSMGFSDYVTMERVLKAQELLATGTYKVYEVAWKLGFDNQYYFSKVFKKTTGKTPSEFAESIRKEK